MEIPEIDYDIVWQGRIDDKAARLILDVSKDWLKEAPIDLARTRIALAVLLQSRSGTDDDRKMSLELYNLNIAPGFDSPGPEQFYSYVGIAEYYSIAHGKPGDESDESATTRWESVLVNANHALKQRQDEKGALGSELDNKRCTTAFWLKAESLQRLDRDNEALETCKQALAKGELEYSAGISSGLFDFLTMIINILTKKDKHFQIIDEVQNCTHKIRVEWLLGLSTYPMELKEKKALRKAAVMTRRVDFLIQLYEQAIEYWHNEDWYGAQLLGFELAVIYRRDARTTRMAELTLDNIMKEVRGNISRSDAGNVLRWMFPEMVDIIFENYTTVRSRVRKEEEMKKLRRLIDDLGPTDILEGIFLAEASLTLAKMLKGLGMVHLAKVEADKSFNLCLNDLQDFVTYNDISAFRILAKLLMFVDLELDAGIALSLQYSDVDRKDLDGDSDAGSVTGGEEPATKTTDEKTEVDENAGAPPTETIVDSSKVTPVPDPKTTEEGTKIDTMPNGTSKNAADVPLQTPITTEETTVPVPGTTDVNGEAKPTEGKDQTTISGAGDENGLSKPSTENAHDTAQDPKTNGTDEKDQQAVKGEEAKEWPEDLIPVSSVDCNGLCSKPPLDRKDGVQSYFCLDCCEVDFCVDCYETQVNYYTKMGEGFWFKCCWAEHKYLMQPVKDWHGVKDGIIRIGAKQKPYNLWLQAVKEKWARKLAL